MKIEKCSIPYGVEREDGTDEYGVASWYVEYWNHELEFTLFADGRWIADEIACGEWRDLDPCEAFCRALEYGLVG